MIHPDQTQRRLLSQHGEGGVQGEERDGSRFNRTVFDAKLMIVRDRGSLVMIYPAGSEETAAATPHQHVGDFYNVVFPHWAL